MHTVAIAQRLIPMRLFAAILTCVCVLSGGLFFMDCWLHLCIQYMYVLFSVAMCLFATSTSRYPVPDSLAPTEA